MPKNMYDVKVRVRYEGSELYHYLRCIIFAEDEKDVERVIRNRFRSLYISHHINGENIAIIFNQD